MSLEKAQDSIPLDVMQLRRLHHQFNQPLTAIGNYAQAGCQLIDQGLGDVVRLRELFEKIASQSNRASTSSQQLGEALGREGPTSR